MVKKRILSLVLMLQFAFFMGIPVSAEAINAVRNGCYQVYKTLDDLNEASENDRQTLERKNLEMEQLNSDKETVLKSFEIQDGNFVRKFLNKIQKLPYIAKYKIQCYLLGKSIKDVEIGLAKAKDFEERLDEIFEQVCREYLYI